MKISLHLTNRDAHHLLQQCRHLKHVKETHAQLIINGLLAHDIRLLGRLFSFVATSVSGDLKYAQLLFSQIHNPNIFFFNTLMRANSRIADASDVAHSNPISLYSALLRSGSRPDVYTFPILLKSLSQNPNLHQGECIHAQTLKLGLDSYLYVNNALIHFYSVAGKINLARRLFYGNLNLDVVSWNSMISGCVREGDMNSAKKLFDEMPERNVISWSALISGFVQLGFPKEALNLFSKMQIEKVRPNEATLATVLSSCAQLGALELGKWIHGYLKSNGFKLGLFIGTSLVDMYAKCGEVDVALEVFYSMTEKNLLSWTTIIKGLAMHGRGHEALSLFSKMEETGIVPDDIVFIGALSACTHTRLVDRGREIFKSMKEDYHITPKIEHYGCLVDLLSRSGLLEEAMDTIKSMPMPPDVLIWGALMAGCRFYRNVELAEYVGKKLMELEPDKSGVYVLLANIYASSNRHDEAGKVRQLMEARGVVKKPGCSLIEVGGTAHQFISGIKTHPQIREILEKWEEIECLIKQEGYEPFKSEVLLDIEDEEKEKALAHHSEKLAIAFGLMSTEPATTIRIVKNLRVCSDCHHVTKLISKVYGREIIVRDRTRFHLFKQGSCTCQDFW